MAAGGRAAMFPSILKIGLELSSQSTVLYKAEFNAISARVQHHLLTKHGEVVFMKASKSQRKPALIYGALVTTSRRWYSVRLDYHHNSSSADNQSL
jgi:hypothetical protein